MRQVAFGKPLMTFHCTIIVAPGVVSKCVMPFPFPPHGACVDNVVMIDSLRDSGCTNRIAYAVLRFKYLLGLGDDIRVGLLRSRVNRGLHWRGLGIVGLFGRIDRRTGCDVLAENTTAAQQPHHTQNANKSPHTSNL